MEKTTVALNETERRVLDEIGGKPISTKVLGVKLGKLGDCPDELLRILNKLRRKGLINGVFSKDSGEWLWSRTQA